MYSFLTVQTTTLLELEQEDMGSITIVYICVYIYNIGEQVIYLYTCIHIYTRVYVYNIL